MSDIHPKRWRKRELMKEQWGMTSEYTHTKEITIEQAIKENGSPAEYHTTLMCILLT